MPRLQRELVVELLRGDPSVDVVGGAATPGTVRAEAVRARAQVVIFGHDDPGTVGEVLERLPRLLVITVTDSQLVAWRYGLAPYRERLGELSPAALSAGIHARESLPAWWTG